MDSMLLQIFQAQVRLQARFALAAYEDLNTTIAEMDRLAREQERVSTMGVGMSAKEKDAIRPQRVREIEELSAALERLGPRPWADIHLALSALANISKLLWGQNKKVAAQREPLRQSFQVDVTSPLSAAARSMRNNFEHLDDRIDQWWGNSVRHNFIDLDIGDVPAVAGAEVTDVFRRFDPTTGKLIFCGQSYNLREAIDELRRIVPIANAGLWSHTHGAA